MEEWSSGGEGDAVEMPEGVSWVREHSTPCNPELRLPVHEQKLQKHPNREETGLSHLPTMWTHETHTRRKGLSRYPLEATWAPSLSFGLCPLSLPREKCCNDTGTEKRLPVHPQVCVEHLAASSQNS